MVDPTDQPSPDSEGAGTLGIPPSPPQTPAKRRSPQRGSGDVPDGPSRVPRLGEPTQGERPAKAARLGEPPPDEAEPHRPTKARRREAARGAIAGGVQHGGSSSSKS